MSQFLTNKYLRYRGLEQAPARVIDADQPCSRCNYNLRGLMNNGQCPECGTPIKMVSPARSELLADSPLSDIRRLAWGLWLCIACIVTAPLVLLLVTGMALQVGRSLGDMIIAVVLIYSAVWVASVWYMTPVLQTPDGIKYGFRAGSRLRQMARWSQLAWPTAIVLVHFASPTLLARMTLLVLILVGLGGLVAMALVLTRLAEWARDESAQRMLNVTVWLLPLSVGILMLLPLITVMRFFTCMAALMWLTSLVTFGLAMLSLAMSAAWSVKHARDRIHRDTELRKRIVRRPPPPPPSDEPIRLAEPGDPMPEIGLVGHADVVITTMDDIVRDVACASCGYNLRGLKVSGKCPECGERIASA